MAAEVIAAIIVAAASLVVATVSLVATVINMRGSERTLKELEQLKQDFARTTKKVGLQDEHFVQALDGLRAGMRAIQVMKDEIQLILSSPGSGLTTTEAIERIKKARMLTFEDYEGHHVNLDPISLRLFHASKNYTLNIENVVLNELGSLKFASQLSSSARIALTEARERLTELQNSMRDSLADRILERISGRAAGPVGATEDESN